MKSFTFYMPTRVLFGKGTIGQLNQEIPNKIKNILLVSDQGVYKTGIIQKIETLLSGRTVAKYLEIPENPTFFSVEKGAAYAKKIQPGMVIGLGGGSVMDAAKGIALSATNPGKLKSYVIGEELLNNPLPVVCIPTTSGTGSEVTPFAVFTDSDERLKLGYANDHLFPVLSIIDPELTYSMPSSLAINTGLDSLSHAIEAFLSTESYPLLEDLSLSSLQIITRNLEKASQGHKPAMDRMAYSAMLSGMAIARASTILPHIMGYPLTIYHGVPHGRAGTILIPAYLDFLEGQNLEKKKLETMFTYFKTVGGLRAFLETLGVSTNLSDYGVKENELQRYAAQTILKGDVNISPGNITEEVILDLYRKSIH